MILDKSTFLRLCTEWCARYKFISLAKIREFLSEAEVKTDRVICPRCQTIYLKEATNCPTCGWKEEQK